MVPPDFCPKAWEAACGKLGVAHWVGTDGVDRSGQGLGCQGKLNDGSQFVSPDPTRPLLPISCPKTHALQGGSAQDRWDTQVHNPDAGFACRSGGRLAILLKAGKKTRSGGAILCQNRVTG